MASPNNKQCIILQRIVPDYRIEFFRTLEKSLGRSFAVTSGSDRFTVGLRSGENPESFVIPVKNTYFFRNKLLWQHVSLQIALETPLLVAELNPRILSTWCVLVLRRCLKRPSVVWGHSRSVGARNPIVASLRFIQCRLAGAVLAYTHTQAREFQNKLPNTPVFVAPNSCVHVDTCNVAHSGVPRDFIYVGRMIPEKKVDLLLRAFAFARSRLPNETRLLLLGDGPDQGKLKQLSKELHLSDRVKFFGHVTEPIRLVSLYRHAVCSVSPGYLGLSAVQSLAHGVPILVSDNEHHSPEVEVCIPDFTALYFESNSVQSLARGLLAFVEDSSNWQARRPQITAFIAHRYSFKAMVDGFVTMVNYLAPAKCSETMRPIQK